MPHLPNAAAWACGVAALIATSAACGTPEAPVPATPASTQAVAPSASPDLQKMIDRFAPTDVTVDLSRLSEGDRGALARLVKAGKIIDALFLRQVWEGN